LHDTAPHRALHSFPTRRSSDLSGAKFFRGGAFKPRTSPYAFSGLGEPGLKILAEIRKEFGLKIVSEALDEANVDLVEKYADMIRSEEHTSELQSLRHLVCRLLL